MTAIWAVPELLAALTLVVCVVAVASHGHPWFRVLTFTGVALAWATTILVSTILVSLAFGPSW